MKFFKGKCILGTLWLLASLHCGVQEGGEQCGIVGPRTQIEAKISRINSIPWNGSQYTDIVVERSPSTPANVVIEFTVRRISGECIIQYLGPLTIALSNPPQGVTALVNPQTLPGANSDLQTLKLTIQIPIDIQDGRFSLYLRAQESVEINPPYNVVVKTLII